MSYIHCHHDGYCTPSESLQGLFEELVIRPFEEREATQSWVEHVRKRDYNYHRRVILDQGRTNFDEEFGSLTPEDKVSLYCVYYMPMHLFSSYAIFTKHLAPILGHGSDQIVFIDFGSGPLTSGIAFRAFAQQRDIVYLGIDSSLAMLKKAQEINEYGLEKFKDPFFSRFELILDYNQLPGLLDKYIVNEDKTQIIFNFCYFLASKTLDINHLSNVLMSIVGKYGKHRMYIVYQNPHGRQELHQNWYTFRALLKQRGFSASELRTHPFSYTRLGPIGGGNHDTSLDYEILYNFAQWRTDNGTIKPAFFIEPAHFSTPSDNQ